MIFWEKSPRNVTMIPSHAGIIPDTTRLVANSETPSCYQRVGVFVDEMAQNIITRVVNFKLDVIQLHGHEEPTLIRNLRSTIDPDLRPGIQIWKAISIMDRNSVAIYKQYEDCVARKQYENAAKVLPKRIFPPICFLHPTVNANKKIKIINVFFFICSSLNNITIITK